VLVLGVVALVVIFDVPLNDPVWWLTNEAPPRVTVGGPGGTVRGTVEARVGLEPATRVKIVSVRVDDQVRDARAGRIVLDTSGMSDGQHRVEVVAHDTSRRTPARTGRLPLITRRRNRISRSIRPRGPQKGTTLWRVRADEPMHDARHARRATPLQRMARWVWLPRARWRDGRKDWAERPASDGVAMRTEQHSEWPIRTPFEDDLDMAPSPSESVARAAEDRQLGAIYGLEDGARQWDGVFRTPVTGEVTTAFGTHRSYEYHPGMDLGVAMGTAVVAPANGTVAFVGSEPARGNVVVLDHGAGVYSTYAHLQEATVGEGTTVKAGQTIARAADRPRPPHPYWEIWSAGERRSAEGTRAHSRELLAPIEGVTGRPGGAGGHSAVAEASNRWRTRCTRTAVRVIRRVD
jgi:murein DD-endopeptidase MepM/ murein hydrolase activator NlpD